MFGLYKRVREVSPAELADKVREGAVELVDVREPAEFAAGHIPGAVNHPLSSFDPVALPADGKPVILYCAAGGRSGTALGRCNSVRSDVDTHLAGGIGSWQRAGLPVSR